MTKLKELKELSREITILYVEDDHLLNQSFTQYLKLIFPSVHSANDGLEGLELFEKNRYDIVITDIQMPRMNGLEMIKAIKEHTPQQEIIITTAFSEVPYLLEAISVGASSYLVKPIDYDLMNDALSKIVSKINVFRDNERYKEKLEEMVKERTRINLALEKEKIDNYEKTLISLVELVEKRDTYTAGHSQRVATYSQAIAQKMGYSTSECSLIYRAGILHDIGKIVTPDAVLLKPGKLDSLEYTLIQEHVTTGAQMLEKIPMYVELSKIVAAHHERYDGSGYPLGLKKDEIPPLSRIMIVADAFDAMTTNRIYKPRMSLEHAIEELNHLSRIQFCPEVVNAAVAILPESFIQESASQLPTNAMEKKRFAFYFEDSVCKIYNARYLDLLLVQTQNNPSIRYFTVFYIHNFTAYNNQYGWEQGDLFLQEFTNILRNFYDEQALFRIHGDDFVLITDVPSVVDLSLFEPLLSVSNHLLSVDCKQFNSQEHSLHSLEEFEMYLKTL